MAKQIKKKKEIKPIEKNFTPAFYSRPRSPSNSTTIGPNYHSCFGNITGGTSSKTTASVTICHLLATALVFEGDLEVKLSPVDGNFSSLVLGAAAKPNRKSYTTVPKT